MAYRWKQEFINHYDHENREIAQENADVVSSISDIGLLLDVVRAGFDQKEENYCYYNEEKCW